MNTTIVVLSRAKDLLLLSRREERVVRYAQDDN